MRHLVSRENYKRHCISYGMDIVSETEAQKQLFKEGKISASTLYRKTSIFKAHYRIEYVAIVNFYGGVPSLARGAKINGNFAFVGTTRERLGDEVITYKARYYTSEGSIAVERAQWQGNGKLDWTWEKINFVFDTELIDLLIEGLRGSRKAEFKRELTAICELHELSTRAFFE
jgi:hypothetical protein